MYGVMFSLLYFFSFFVLVLQRLVEPGDEDLLERSLRNIKTPVMLVWGKKDQVNFLLSFDLEILVQIYAR